MMNILKSFTYVALDGTIFFGGMVTTGGAADSMMKHDNPAFNDLEIAHIAYAASALDIRHAHLALALSENPEVKKFAELMIRDHTAINNKALALVKKLNITPQDNAISQQLVKGGEDILKEFSRLRENAFAKRYAENELAYHKLVVKTIDETFLPTAQNEELKALLRGANKTFKVHEGHAETMNANAQKL